MKLHRDVKASSNVHMPYLMYSTREMTSLPLGPWSLTMDMHMSGCRRGEMMDLGH